MDFNTELVSNIPKLKNFANKLCYGDTLRRDDLVQDTILKALEKQHQFQDRGLPLSKWLGSIMFNHSVNEFRKRKSYRNVDDLAEVLPDYRSNPETITFTKEVLAAYGTLAEHYQQAIMNSINGMKQQDIAKEAGVPVGTIKSRLNLSRTKLAELLETTAEMKTRQCKECERPFTFTRSNTLFCSGTCGDKNYKRLKAKAKNH